MVRWKIISIAFFLFQQINYDQVDTALNAVKKNHAWGLLYFPNNYTKSLAVRVKKFPRISNLYFNSSAVQVWIDYSSKSLKVSI